MWHSIWPILSNCVWHNDTCSHNLRSIRDIFIWQIVWHFIWPTFRHVFWNISYILKVYPTYNLTHCLTNIGTCSDILSGIYSHVQPGILTFFLAYSCILTCWTTFTLTLCMKHILTKSLIFYGWHQYILYLYSDILKIWARWSPGRGAEETSGEHQ